MKFLILLFICFVGSQARTFYRQPMYDEPFDVNNALFSEDPDVEKGELFTEERLEKELLNSDSPINTFQGTIVTRDKQKLSSIPTEDKIEPTLRKELELSKEISLEEAEESKETSSENSSEGSADSFSSSDEEESTEDETTTEEETLNLSTSAETSTSIEAFESSVATAVTPEHPTLIPDIENSVNTSTITSQLQTKNTSFVPMMADQEIELEGSGSEEHSSEEKLPFDLDGFGEITVPLNNKLSVRTEEVAEDNKSKNSQIGGRVRKIFGETGSDEDKASLETTTLSNESTTQEKIQIRQVESVRKPTPSGTFLEDELLPIFLRKKSKNSLIHAPARRGDIEGCPAPQLCGKNCFVALDSNGCQICQCLWQALACETNDDCPESIQICDLGKCECSQGYEQDMRRSGMCKPFESDVISKDSLANFAIEAQEVHRGLKEKNAIDSPIIKHFGFSKKHLRVARGALQKLSRPERLQWPGRVVVSNF